MTVLIRHSSLTRDTRSGGLGGSARIGPNLCLKTHFVRYYSRQSLELGYLSSSISTWNMGVTIWMVKYLCTTLRHKNQLPVFLCFLLFYSFMVSLFLGYKDVA